MKGRAARICFTAALLFAPSVIRAQAPPPPPKETREYSLPPDKLKRAVEYAHARYWLHFSGEIYDVAILLAILALRLPAKFRDWAETASRRRYVQAVIFVPLLMLTIDILSLPLALWSQHLELAFDQSIETWPAWFWDWTKGEIIGLVVAIVLVMILYAVIRRSPRRWWFYFWLAILPIVFVSMFLEPFVIEPLFFKFAPLSARHRELVAELEKVVARGGLAIPPDRMFEMKASAKLNSLNAYVTGIGASKRVVIWDTTLSALSTPEVLSVFGHEMGHYVLGHVRDSAILSMISALILLYAGYRLLGWTIRRWGGRWRIRGQDDWASLAAMMLIASLFGILSEPIMNSYSRWLEHQADVYGLEVIHGLVPDSAQVTAHAFQVLGELSLDEPNPPPFIEFWIFSHPSISERIAFSLSYDPWTKGTPRYVK